uniref:Amicyanin n=1 Tax=Paracoccus denitrificans TaxID=266 RepID=UPI0001BE666E|nr:Chain A, Amicyanin [Paracoccus denitrificans]3IEA_A Chain A, Amicyanin [Paracoccus denitrificans]
DKATIPSESPFAAAEVADGAIVVDIAKMKYETPELHVKVGDTVTWINREAMPHNVHFVAGVLGEAALKGPMMKKEQAYSLTFTEAGTYDYHCTPHPFLRGKVVVE